MAVARKAGRPNGGRVSEYRMYFVEVARTQRLGPSFVRVTFTGECLRAFGSGGLDQRIRLLLPQPGRTTADIPAGPDWLAVWQAMPATVQPTMRSYTVRTHRPELAELDVDFVLHGAAGGHGGPVSAWAATTRPGAGAALAGPDRANVGRRWGCEWSPPATARRLMLAGDETAVPAVASIVESLPPDAHAVVCLEVPTTDDRQCWNVPDRVEVRWSARRQAGGSASHGSLLEAAVAEALAELCGTDPATAGADLADVDTSNLWEIPDETTCELDASGDELYAWLAGEAGMIRRLRRLMLDDHGVPRNAVAFMGYWRLGHSG